MRKILLASAGILALGMGAAFADSQTSTTGNNTAVAVPIVKNAAAVATGSAPAYSATTGGTAGNLDNNTVIIPNKNAAANNHSNAATSGGVAGSIVDSQNSLAFAAPLGMAVSNGTLTNTTTLTRTTVVVGNNRSEATIKDNNFGGVAAHAGVVDPAANHPIYRSGEVEMIHSVNGNTGITVTQASTGVGALNQNSGVVTAVFSPGALSH